MHLICCCLVAKPCPTLWGSSVNEISQARNLEWVAISFSRGSSWVRDQTLVPESAGWFLTAEPPGKPTPNISSVQCSSAVQSCPTLCNPMNHSTLGLPVHHQLPESTQTHVHHQVGDATQPSHPLLSPSPPAPKPSRHQGLFQWVNSSHEVAKVLEFQL